MIERLRPGEGPRLRAIRLRALADVADAFATRLEAARAWDPQRWEAQVEQLPTFVWCEDDADLALVLGAPHRGDSEAGHLIAMWVAPEARGRGIGGARVGGIVAWASEGGLRRFASRYRSGGSSASGPSPSDASQSRATRSSARSRAAYQSCSRPCS